MANRVACVIDTCEVRVVCKTPAQTVGEFGREGEGPGEFLDPSWLGRIDPGRVGVVDYDLDRLTVFEAGERVWDVTLPPLFLPRYVGRSSLVDHSVLVDMASLSAKASWDGFQAPRANRYPIANPCDPPRSSRCHPTLAKLSGIGRPWRRSPRPNAEDSRRAFLHPVAATCSMRAGENWCSWRIETPWPPRSSGYPTT